MSMRPTPLLSPEGSQEVLDEMARPPADTPGRRRIFEAARQMHPHVARLLWGEDAPEAKG
jgi:hypothetical protein